MIQVIVVLRQEVGHTMPASQATGILSQRPASSINNNATVQQFFDYEAATHNKHRNTCAHRSNEIPQSDGAKSTNLAGL